MTNEKYFKALLGYAPSADEVEGALTDAGITGSDTYVVANSVALKTAAISSMQRLLSTPDTTSGSGETQNAIKFDRTAVLQRIRLLQDELEVVVSGPTIKRVSKW